MILRLYRGKEAEIRRALVEDIVLGGVALAERHLDRGDVGEAYRMIPHLERLNGYDLVRDTALLTEREVALGRLMRRIVDWEYNPPPEPTFPDAA